MMKTPKLVQNTLVNLGHLEFTTSLKYKRGIGHLCITHVLKAGQSTSKLY